MDPALLNQLQKIIPGGVATDDETLQNYSHDTSLFEVKPQVVVTPKNATEIKKLVKWVTEHKKRHPTLSLTGRSAGTDMSGGAINESIIVTFQKYFNKIISFNENLVTVQAGVFYRDFEEKTLKRNLIFPSYPASKSICAMGGIINNNSGGEKSLQYGKTERYVKKVNVVLSDGNEYILEPLNEKQLKQKMALKNFEGHLYRNMHTLITKNYHLIQKAKPNVTKNSAGYFLWNVYDKKTGIFDLTKLWVGAQGTLGMLLKAEIELVPVKKHHAMEVIFLNDLSHLGKIIDTVLPLEPESFESYDDNTLKLALRYFPEFAKQLGVGGLIQSGLAFLPAFMQMVVGKLPKLILQVDFAGDDLDELKQKIATLKEKLKLLHLQTRIAVDGQEKHYWLVRRESFNLLRKKIRDKHTAPFIDDFVIDPHKMEDVVNQVTAILKKYPEFIFTVAGHVGNGNFHIIPIADIKNPKVREAIPIIAKKVYEIVIKAGGSTTGEHNDGLIRTPYLEQMYGKEVVKLFEKTKHIFDPLNIFNPRKKVHGDLDFAMKHIRTEW